MFWTVLLYCLYHPIRQVADLHAALTQALEENYNRQ